MTTQPPKFPLRYRLQSIQNDSQRTTFMFRCVQRGQRWESRAPSTPSSASQKMPWRSSGLEPWLLKHIHGHIIHPYISIYSESQEYRQIVIYNKNYLGSVYDAQVWSLHHSWSMYTSAQPFHLWTDESCYFTKPWLDYASHPKASQT